MKSNYFFIANAHLDPVWQWCVPEGLSLVKSTFRSALDRMNEYPDYIFTSACAGYYKWIKLNEPEMFDEIKQRVKEGRWAVVGGMWVQPDCNIPSGEAFCRHFLYSQKFFKENFGAPVKTGYNVDSFGHNGMLPQILKKSGIDNYVYHRPDNNTEKPNLPFESLHYWQSPDGSIVKAFRIPDGYGGDVFKERLEDHYFNKNQPMMIFIGVGNHGGGPSKEHLRHAQELIEKGGFKFATPDEYFENTDIDNIPWVKEDLQHHASGCYSANAKIKEVNRRAETELVTAEKLDVLANALTGSLLHSQQLESGWERVMFNQFHDILAGCSIKEADKDAHNAFGYARETALDINTFAAQRISWRIKTTDFLNADVSEMRGRMWYKKGEGSPLVVFNPHSFPVKSIAQFGDQGIAKVLDSDGNIVPHQLVRASYTDGDHIMKCIFEADIPAYGYAVYYAYHKEFVDESINHETDLIATDSTLENSRVKIIFNKETGAVSSYIVKESVTEFARGDLGKAIVCDDIKNDTWGHKVYDYNIEIGAFGNGTLELVENGPIRATLKSVVKYGNSVLKRYYSLYKNSEKLFVRTVLDFDEEYKSVKLSFKTNIDDAKVTYSMPYGFITKETDGQEEPCHAWCDVHNEQGTGLALLNTSKYSFCSVGSDLRMMIARGCAYLDHYGQRSRDGEMEFLDKGEQEFFYEIVPHTECNNSELFKASELLNNPLQTHQETHHDGNLPQVYNGLEVDKDNIIVTAIKAAEDGNGYVLRAVEADGKKTEAKIIFKAINAELMLNFNPQEIKTVRIYSDGTIKESLITEQVS
ncbi:MAG: alpha-mannosidase [Clostridia bacterium]|nr:alpha-mannosidase [Clostridia bacterium]